MCTSTEDRSMNPTFHRAIGCASATLLSLLSGCGVTPMQINQSNVTSAALDGVYRFTPGGAGGLQVQVEGYRAKATQRLDDSTSIYAGQELMLSGPLDIHHRATVQRAFFGYNHQLFADLPLRLRWFAGIGWARTRWTAVPQTATPQTYHWDISGTGPAGGALATWQLTPLLALEAAAYGGMGGWSADAASVDWSQTELGLALKFAAPTRLRLGWSKRSLRAASPNNGLSDLSADTRGPYLKLAFEFR